ncbi:MAG: carboxyltransferase domain-containing protein, partial [Phascolarctobacterium sp.]|nr:carboxyltransferase domain-containing protein [Phascolarctobacterium sp.]
IYMLGFLPGFVYLGGLDEKIHAPRLQSPRTAIPAGSVAIGGGQTGIYPIASPGGWRLIGRTPLKLYDPERLEPILCKAGEYIRFVPISEERFQEIEEQLAIGAYTPHCVEIGGAE